MGASELTFGASADVAVARALTVGAVPACALALPRDDGDDRLTAGVRVIVAAGRLRGKLSIAIRFC